MLRKLTIVLLLMMLGISFFSCKKIETDLRTTTSNTVSQLTPIPLPTPVLFFNEVLVPGSPGKSPRWLTYKGTNLDAVYPTIFNFPAKQTLPYSYSTDWGINHGTNEMWSFKTVISNQKPTDFLSKHSLVDLSVNVAQTPFNVDQSAYNRGHVIIDHKNKKLFYLVKSNPPVVPNGTNEYLYNQIRSSDLDGANEKIVFTSPVSQIHGMDLDINKGLLYFIETLNNTVSVINTNGTGYKPLIANAGVGSIFSVVRLDPTTQKVYWTSTSLSSESIMRADYNGLNKIIVVKKPTPTAGRIMVFDIDRNHQYIFYNNPVSTKDGMIYYLNRINVDGVGDKVITKLMGYISELRIVYPEGLN